MSRGKKTKGIITNLVSFSTLTSHRFMVRESINSQLDRVGSFAFQEIVNVFFRVCSIAFNIVFFVKNTAFQI